LFGKIFQGEKVMSESEKTLAFNRQAVQAILIATFIVGISAISNLVSFATLIFSGTCPDFLGAGVALFFLAGYYCCILGGDASKCRSENHFFQSVCCHCTFNDTDRYLLCVFRIF
jgi:hypothetical protein